MMKKIIKNIKIFAALLVLVGCETTNFDLQENPNFLTPENANPEFLLNEIQYLFQDIVSDMILNSDDVMRYEAMTSSYGDIVDVNVLNVEWERFYEAINISKTIDNLASQNSNYLYHNAVNKLLMGYLTITMVDYVGDIPYSQAGNPLEFPNPKSDSSIDLYKMVLTNIDQSIVDINNATVDVRDLFYSGDKENWIAFANTLKLRILVQARLASADLGISDLQGEINSLLNKNIIDAPSEDFVWKYANGVDEPESRHPYFRRAYVSSFSQYIGNQFMWMLKDSKSVRDPRIRYYLYRQDDRDPFSGPPYLACQGDPSVDYCYVGDHYWGLDHGESRTGRGDNLFRTTYGIYPGGGSLDQDFFVNAPSTTSPENPAGSLPNLNGQGILPILTSSFVKFLRAEASLTISGVNGNPETLLEEAVRESIDKVTSFGGQSFSLSPTNTDIENYVTEVKNNYTNAADTNAKLDVIMTEYYLAAFGNSIEAYNAYRRTGFPSLLQVPIDDDNPTFPRSFRYSKTAVDRNTSLNQKSITEKIFWDTNPDNFIK